MISEFFIKLAFWVAFALVMAFLRLRLPPRERASEHPYNEMQTPEPFAAGVVGGAMWGMALLLVLTFFLFKDLNHAWVRGEGTAELVQYPTQFLWCLFPGFAALSIPWPLAVWGLRRMGRWEEADSIEDDSDRRGGLNTYRMMRAFSLYAILPMGFLTLLATPIHLSVQGYEVRVGHYGSLRTERFDLREVRRATLVEGSRSRDGSISPSRDLILDFSDGRRLRGNEVGDGGTNILPEVQELLLKRTGLLPEHAETADDVPRIHP